MTDATELQALPEDAQRRVGRAIDTARKAIAGDPGLRAIYLKRFHRAMDDLQGPDEGAAVHAALCGEPWYVEATSTRKAEL